MEQVQTTAPMLPLTSLEGFRILMHHGIIGFPDLKHYMLKPILSDQTNTLFWRFESQDHKEISFILLESGALAEKVAIDPFKIDEALEAINEAPGTMEVFYIVTLENQGNNHKKVTVNIRAPLIINPETSHAWQVILNDSNYPIDYEL